MTIVKRRTAEMIGAHIAAAILLSWPAIANGFPMLFADSAAYLRVGTEFVFLLDRPVTYGLAIAPLHRLFGLWGVVAGQALFAVWLIGRALHVAGMRSAWALVGVAAWLAVSSSLPWFVGQVMPDLFTGLALVTAFILLAGRDAITPWERWLHLVLLTGMCAFHLTHPLTVSAAAAAAVCVRSLGGRWPWRAAIEVIGAAVVALLALSSLNLATQGRFQPSVMSSTMMAGRLFDVRLAQAPLAARCAKNPAILLCRVRPLVDRTDISEVGQHYLWDDDTPRDVDNTADWWKMRAEEAALVDDVFTHQRPAVIRAALDGWGQQLVHARSADGLIAFPPGHAIETRLKADFASGVPAWRASLQQAGRLQALAVMPDRWIALALLIAAPVMLWFAVRRGDSLLVVLTAMVATTLIVNAAQCGALSGPFDRYQSRVLWLVPFVAAVALLRWRKRSAA